MTLVDVRASPFPSGGKKLHCTFLLACWRHIGPEPIRELGFR